MHIDHAISSNTKYYIEIITRFKKLLFIFFLYSKYFTSSYFINFVMLFKKRLKGSFALHLIYILYHILNFGVCAKRPKRVQISPRLVQWPLQVAVYWEIRGHQRLERGLDRKPSFFEHCRHLEMIWESLVPPFASLGN